MNPVQFLRDRASGRTEEGITLAETVVAMGIGSLLLGLLGTFVVASTQTLDTQQRRNTGTLQVTTALDLVAKQIRTTYAPPGAAPVLLAQPEVYGFYANLMSLDTSSPAGKSATFKPEEIWVWTETVGDRRRLCDQVRPVSLAADGSVVAPATDLSVAANRTCREVVSTLATPDPARPTFTYLSISDPLTVSPTAGTGVTTTSTGVLDSRRLHAVQVTVRAEVGNKKGSTVLTTTDLVNLPNDLSGGAS